MSDNVVVGTIGLLLIAALFVVTFGPAVIILVSLFLVFGLPILGIALVRRRGKGTGEYIGVCPTCTFRNSSRDPICKRCGAPLRQPEFPDSKPPTMIRRPTNRP